MPLLLADHHIPAPSHRAAPCLSLRGDRQVAFLVSRSWLLWVCFGGLFLQETQKGSGAWFWPPPVLGPLLRASSVRGPRGPPASPGFGL